MASLTGQTVSSTYDGLLKTDDNDILGAAPKEITDGLGNGSGMTLSTTGDVSIAGDLTVDGAILDSNGVPGASGQILSSTVTGIDWVDLSEISGVDGSGTANYIAKWTDGDTIGNSVIYDNGTNIGIGTSTPAYTLDVNGTPVRFTRSGKSISLNGNFANANTHSSIQVDSGMALSVDIASFGEAMRITSTGNVGIGTSSPTEKLEVNGTGRFTNSSTAIGIILNRGLDVNSVGDAGVGMKMGSLDGTTYKEGVAMFGGLKANGDDGYFLIQVRKSNVMQSRLAINEDGNVGIGTTNPTTKLDVVGTYRMQFRTDDAIPELRAITANGAAFKELGLNGSQLVFNTSSTERMRIDSSGNVNINTTTGNGSLNVKAPTGNGLISIITGTTTSDSIRINSGGSTTNWLEYRGYLGHAWFTDAGLGNTERMRIDSSGNVGIGTDNASAKLSIHGAAGTSIIKLSDTGVNENYGGYVKGYGAAGAGGRLDLGVIDNAVYRRGIVINEQLTSIQFFIGSSETERMRITSGGFLKASNTGSYNNVSGSYHEQVSDIPSSIITNFQHTSSVAPYGIDIDFSNSSPNNSSNYFIYAHDSTALKFVVYSNGNVQNTNNSYGVISDIKLKENITDATPKLDDLMQVKIRNYNLIGEEIKQIGVVAQELEQVFPALIDEHPDTEEQQVPQLDENGQEVLDENGDVVMTTERVDLGTTTKSVKMSVFVPMLIKAMQEQQEIINDLKTRIQTLENN